MHPFQIKNLGDGAEIEKGVNHQVIWSEQRRPGRLDVLCRIASVDFIAPIAACTGAVINRAVSVSVKPICVIPTTSPT